MIVVGLGALGAATARALAVRGASVIGIDPRPAGHAEGSSHGGSRILRRALFEHPDYVAVVDRSIELWRELESSSRRHLFDESVGLVLGAPPEGALIRGTRAAARHHALPIEDLVRADWTARHPIFAVPEDFELLLDPAGGILRPEEAVLALLEDAAARGAELRHGASARAWRCVEQGVEVDTDRGRLSGGSLVLAAGPWSPRILGAGADLRIRRKVLRWHRPEPGSAWALGVAPIFAFEDGDSLLYGFPALDERGVKIADHGGGAELESPEPGLDPEAEDLRIDGLRRRFLRGLEETAAERATCFYTMSPDGHPLIGAWPDAPGVFVAAGLSGHGFKHAAAFGESLARLALGQEPAVPLSLFEPGRFSS